MKALLHPVEEVGVALGPQESPQELPAGPRVVREASAIPLEAPGVLSLGRVPVLLLEERDRHIPIPDLTDQAGQPTDAEVEGLEELPVPAREELPPDLETGAEPPHLAVEAVEAPRGGVGTLEDLVHGADHGGEEAIELPHQGDRRNDPGRRRRDHDRPSVPAIVSPPPYRPVLSEGY